MNQEHLHKAGWPVKGDVYPTIFLNAICQPQAAERVIPSCLNDQLNSGSISIAKYTHTCSSKHLVAVWKDWGSSNDSGARDYI